MRTELRCRNITDGKIWALTRISSTGSPKIWHNHLYELGKFLSLLEPSSFRPREYIEGKIDVAPAIYELLLVNAVESCVNSDMCHLTRSILVLYKVIVLYEMF